MPRSDPSPAAQGSRGPAPEAPGLSRSSEGATEAAAERAARRWAARCGDAVSQEVVYRSISLITEALGAAHGAPLPPALLEDPSLMGVQRPLVDLIREDLLLAPSSLSNGDLVGLLRRLEEVRSALDPGWSGQVQAGLMGPEASEMLAEVGHDLRSPLTSVLFLAEVLRSAPGIRDDEHPMRQLGLIYSAAFTMLQIVNNFVELAHGGCEVGPGSATSFSLQELAEEVRRAIQPMADDKGLALVVDTSDLRHDRRLGNPVPLSRILLNLLTNGVKFTHEGSVTLRIRDEPPPHPDAAGAVHVEVADTGPGLPAEAPDALFQVFEPAQDRSGLRLSGSGLGLVIVRRLLEAMGSSLSWESSPGVGTTFRFALPLPVPAPGDSVAERRDPANGHGVRPT